MSSTFRLRTLTTDLIARMFAGSALVRGQGESSPARGPRVGDPTLPTPPRTQERRPRPGRPPGADTRVARPPRSRCRIPLPAGRDTPRWSLVIRVARSSTRPSKCCSPSNTSPNGGKPHSPEGIPSTPGCRRRAAASPVRRWRRAGQAWGGHRSCRSRRSVRRNRRSPSCGRTTARPTPGSSSGWVGLPPLKSVFAGPMTDPNASSRRPLRCSPRPGRCCR